MKSIRTHSGNYLEEGPVAWFLVLYAFVILFIANTPTESKDSLFAVLLPPIVYMFLFIPFVSVKVASIRKIIFAVCFIFPVYVLVTDGLTSITFIFLSSYFSSFLLYLFLMDGKADRSFSRAVDWVIYSWILTFVTQILLYFLSGNIVDIHALIFPYSAARITDISFGVPRFTGAHIEPGTYSNWMYGFLLIRIFLKRTPLGLLPFFAVFTIFLTFSFWGALASACYIMGSLVVGGKKRSSRYTAILILLAGSALLVWLISSGLLQPILDYYAGRSTLVDGSGESKVSGFNGFISNFSSFVLVGEGFSYDFCNGCLSPQDTGVLVNAIVAFGMIPSLVIFGTVLRASTRALGTMAGSIFIIPILFTKYYVSSPTFWLIIFMALYSMKKTEPTDMQDIERSEQPA